ncbi:MAG: hypothetical protein ACHQC8_07090 [Solirubrobacterales bacterium]
MSLTDLRTTKPLIEGAARMLRVVVESVGGGETEASAAEAGRLLRKALLDEGLTPRELGLFARALEKP